MQASDARNRRSVPEYLKEFYSVFSKESFDSLPESKKLDHAVELIPGEKASNCYDFDRFSLYRRDRIQSVSDNAQASVQGAS